MIESMTGYGKSSAGSDDAVFAVEIRTLNHRFCDVSIKAPHALLAFEGTIRKKAADALVRGKIDIFITQEAAGGTRILPHWDREVAGRYREIFGEMSRELQLSGDISLGLLAAQKEVISTDVPDIPQETMERNVLGALEGALEAVRSMRATEGAALADDIAQRLAIIGELVKKMTQRAPEVPRIWRLKLLDRLKKLEPELAFDPQRIAQEVAFFADRCDVSEEIARMGSHLEQFRTLLAGNGATGRQLDFLTQEMGREINTIGSKANDITLSQLTVAAKGELEKIREQVQNVM